MKINYNSQILAQKQPIMLCDRSKNSKNVTFGVNISPPIKDWAWMLEPKSKGMLEKFMREQPQELDGYTFYLEGLPQHNSTKCRTLKILGKIPELPHISEDQRVRLNVQIHNYNREQNTRCIGEHPISEILLLLCNEAKRQRFKQFLVELFKTRPINTKVPRYNPTNIKKTVIAILPLDDPKF